MIDEQWSASSVYEIGTNCIMTVRDRRMNGVPNGLNGGPVVRQQKRGTVRRALAWVDAKIFVYNVTFGLYMLDWWERILFNGLALLLLWFLCYNTLVFFIGYAKGAGEAFIGWTSLWSGRDTVNGLG